MSRGMDRVARSRPRVLCAVRYYLPGYRAGGPTRSVSNLVDALGGDFDFRVVCLDRDLGRTRAHEQIEPRVWTRVGRALVLYLPPADVTAATWRELLRELEPDLLYTNSLMDVGFSIVPAWCARARDVPVVVAPRGELSSGALELKAVRKRVFLSVVRLLPMYRDVVWHACSSSEADDIRRQLPRGASNVEVAENVSDAVPVAHVGWTPKPIGVLRVIFLSRIVRKKNLLAAIRIVAAAGGQIRLDIWGPTEDEVYAEECRQVAAAAPEPVEIRWRGNLRHEDVSPRMLEYDALLLPTLGENFGHVIFEALSSGLPVVTSDQTPWRELQRHGVGADLPLDREDAFVDEVRRLRDMAEDAHSTLRSRCVAFAVAWLRESDGVAAHRRMFRRAMGKG